MAAGDGYINTSDFASSVGISRRKASKALRTCHQGQPWRTVVLNVRRTMGRGGAAGETYEVAFDSIPPKFLKTAEAPITVPQEASETPLTAAPPAGALSVVTPPPPAEPVEPAGRVTILPPDLTSLPPIPRARVTSDSRIGNWRLEIIRPILAGTVPRSRERAEAIKALDGQRRLDWRGKKHSTLRERTVREWIARYEAHGIEGLMRKSRPDRGRRVLFSRRWDNAMRKAGVSQERLAAIVADIRKRVRSEWANKTPSWPTVQLNTLPTVISLTRAAGVNMDDGAAMRALCQVPRRFVEAERGYAIVAMKDNDAARYAAIAIPRIKRDRSHLRPMQWVAADVHHVDILFRRPDGTDCTPKAVAWLDLATNRARLDIFIVPKGQMIRREHVIQSFVDMSGDPDWGVPDHLYVDNGGEYNWTDLASDLSKLKRKVDIQEYGAAATTGKPIQKAKPYNPQGKVIEGLFSNLEQSVFPQLPGYIGGERMRKKTQNQGRTPNPFPGDEAALREAIKCALAYYHVRAQTGHLAGTSPNDAFRRFVNDGWRSTTLDPWDLMAAFCTETVKPVRTGGTIRLDGIDFRAEPLLSMVGQRVLVRQPSFGDRDQLIISTEHDEPICVARPDTIYAFGDPAGAEAQGTRQGRLNRQVRALKANTVRLDGQQSMHDVVAIFEPSARAETDGVIHIDPDRAAAGRMVRDAPAPLDEAARREAAHMEQRDLIRRLSEGSRQRMAG
jgi:hypothetical protein